MVRIHRVRIRILVRYHELVDTGLADDMTAGFRKHGLQTVAQRFLAAGADAHLVSCLLVLLFEKVDRH